MVLTEGEPVPVAIVLVAAESGDASTMPSFVSSLKAIVFG